MYMLSPDILLQNGSVDINFPPNTKVQIGGHCDVSTMIQNLVKIKI